MDGGAFQIHDGVDVEPHTPMFYLVPESILIVFVFSPGLRASISPSGHQKSVLPLAGGALEKYTVRLLIGQKYTTKRQTSNGIPRTAGIIQYTIYSYQLSVVLDSQDRGTELQ